MIDIVFSLDSVITAVGMVDELWVMVRRGGGRDDRSCSWPRIRSRTSSSAHPTVKMLALSFLLMIGVFLIADGLHFHIPKGYLYFSLAFSVLVEALNQWARRRRKRARARA